MTVYLVGAGPGDPGLLTVRGAEVLARADVVVHDRLSAAELLDLAPPDAERIDVGKAPKAHRMAQDQINALLVERGRSGQTVVRLKGGDPFVFARGSEEAAALAAAGVPVDIVVRGNIGHMSAFMAQSGNLVVLGDAGDALGDSIYEARLFVRGKVESLGADCIAKEMRPEHIELLQGLLDRAGISDVKPSEFKRYGSARKLYNFNIDNADAY